MRFVTTESLRRTPGTRRAALALLLLACSLGLGCGQRGDAERERSRSRPATGALDGAAGEALELRGLLVLDDTLRAFRACGDSAICRVVDETDGDLELAYASLGPGRGAPIYVEARGRRIAGSKGAPAGGVSGAVAITAMRRASYATEGGGCDEGRDQWAFRARGADPGWSVAVTARMILLQQEEEPARIEFPVVRAQLVGGRRLYTTRTTQPVPHTLELALEERRCSEPGSGEIFPFTAAITLDGRTLHGCASEGGLVP
jgi:putative lipoprotein